MSLKIPSDTSYTRDILLNCSLGCAILYVSHAAGWSEQNAEVAADSRIEFAEVRCYSCVKTQDRSYRILSVPIYGISHIILPQW
jgi:hypothetical protein